MDPIAEPWLSVDTEISFVRIDAINKSHTGWCHATLAALAQYFANQLAPAPAPSARDATSIAAGNKIFNSGIEAKGVAACAACHGTHAEGFWIFPRLAGQHARYVERQLKNIQMQLRNSPLMHGVVKNLSQNEIEEVAAFVQSQ